MSRMRDHNLAGDNMNYTLEEVSQELGVTKTRVRQIEKLAMRNFVRRAKQMRLWDSIVELAAIEGKTTLFDGENRNENRNE